MSWLKDVTNKDEAYWVARVQQLIADNTEPDGKGHGQTDTNWAVQLVDEIVTGLPSEGTYDGNMRLAATLSAVLGLWYNQVHYAKSQDSHRPVFERQLAYLARTKWVLGIVQNIIDFSQSATFFPGQPWENPWSPTAKSGDFK